MPDTQTLLGKCGAGRGYEGEAGWRPFPIGQGQDEARGLDCRKEHDPGC